MRRRAKQTVLAALAVSLLLLAAGCNTMAGFGKDLEKLGNEIQETAEKR